MHTGDNHMSSETLSCMFLIFVGWLMDKTSFKVDVSDTHLFWMMSLNSLSLSRTEAPPAPSRQDPLLHPELLRSTRRQQEILRGLAQLQQVDHILAYTHMNCKPGNWWSTRRADWLISWCVKKSFRSFQLKQPVHYKYLQPHNCEQTVGFNRLVWRQETCGGQREAFSNKSLCLQSLLQKQRELEADLNPRLKRQDSERRWPAPATQHHFPEYLAAMASFENRCSSSGAFRQNTKAFVLVLNTQVFEGCSQFGGGNYHTYDGAAPTLSWRLVFYSEPVVTIRGMGCGIATSRGHAVAAIAH